MVHITSVLAPLLKSALTWLSRRRLPKMDGELSLRGLQAPVEVLRDRWGVPHIYAESTSDLFIAQGFVHAQDRLWQMEVNRRTAAGRLAEMLGPDAVEMDRQMRTLTLRRVAEQEAQLLEPEVHALLNSYARGVNAYIERGTLPVEFTLLRHKPERWTPADTLSWAKMMAWVLCEDWQSEARRAQLADRLGEERAEQLSPPYLADWPRVVPPGLDYSVLSSVSQDTQSPQSASSPSATGGVGSNNWVVAGSRTATGSPILANDMHLGMTIPAVWYENHLVGGDLNVTGVTFPGIPAVVSGHNGHVAWGFTDGVPDVQDLYVERLRRTVDGRVQVEYEGGWYEATLLREAIHVKGGETVYEDVIITRHGPIINRLIPEFGDDPPLAMRWTSLEPDAMVESLLKMNRARNCPEFREAMRGWSSPVQNTVYADVEGNIGYSFPGKIPIRAQGDGRLPVPGWTSDYEWLGYIPFDELPHLHNPPQGYVASANNAVVDDDYPYDLAVRPSAGHRAKRIVELIESRPAVDVAFTRQMHLDVVSTMARKVVHYVEQLAVDEELEPVVALLRKWDGALTLNSAAGAVYELFCREMISLTLSDVLEGQLLSTNRTWWWLEYALAHPGSAWFDLGNGETRDDVMRMALSRTVARLKSACGPTPDDWGWGKLHKMTYGHVLGLSDLLAPVFNRGPYPIPGDIHTIFATHGSDMASVSISGPPYRMIVDLGDVRNSIGSLTPGQSGRLGSPHYDDQIEPWSAGEYHPMLYIREDVEQHAVHRLHLVARDPDST
ncbi:MAG: penicillin acylase family protein [Anaerolineae bacterium]